jgi:hypothetical protein
MKKLPPADNLERYLWCHGFDQDPRSTHIDLYILHTKSPMMLLHLYYLNDENRLLNLTPFEICPIATQLEDEDNEIEQFVIRAIVLYEEAPYEVIKKVVEGAIDWYLGEPDSSLKVSTMSL